MSEKLTTLTSWQIISREGQLMRSSFSTALKSSSETIPTQYSWWQVMMSSGAKNIWSMTRLCFQSWEVIMIWWWQTLSSWHMYLICIFTKLEVKELISMSNTLRKSSALDGLMMNVKTQLWQQISQSTVNSCFMTDKRHIKLKRLKTDKIIKTKVTCWSLLQGFKP